jgi:hypothetical protein
MEKNPKILGEDKHENEKMTPPFLTLVSLVTLVRWMTLNLWIMAKTTEGIQQIA